MRIFERLRGKNRNESRIEPRRVETVFTDLLVRIDEENSTPAATACAVLCLALSCPNT